MWFKQDYTKPLDFSLWDENKIETILNEVILESTTKLNHFLENNSPISFGQIEFLISHNEKIDFIWNVFQSLLQANATPKLEEVSSVLTEKISQYSSNLLMNEVLFKKIQAIYHYYFSNDKKNLDLTTEQQSILKKIYSDFIRNGAMLNNSKKEKCKLIDQQLSLAQLQFSQNIRNYSSHYLIEATKDELIGIPESMIDQFSQKAILQKTQLPYAIGLDMPSVSAVLTFAQNRNLRQKIQLAYNSRCLNGDHSNVLGIQRILSLRLERAKLLNFQDHAHYILEERMAQNAQNVESFLSDILSKSLPKAKTEIKDLEKFAQKRDGINRLESFDVSYYAEIYRQDFFQVDDEKIRDYFPLKKVIEGLFQICQTLYNLTFEKIENKSSLYHPDVLVFKVNDEGAFLGYLYMDLYPRDSKQNGAWMSAFLEQGKSFNQKIRPHISIVGNFRKPSEIGAETYLALSEVETFFHEFGHALHGLLSQCEYRTLSGTNVKWDFVELPSQIFENWVFEESVLPLISQNKIDGSPMPISLLNNIKKAQNFLKAVQVSRQVRYALLDMKLHTINDLDYLNNEFNIFIKEEEILSTSHYLPTIEGTLISSAFSHIFEGGYSAGYYSYHWAEVLDAHAFSYFQEHGVLNKKAGLRFKQEILSKGGTVDPNILYENFRGKKVDSSAFLKRSGLD